MLAAGERQGVISSRSILLFVIGGLLIFCGLSLERMVGDDVPFWTQAFVVAFGLFVIGAGVFGVRFDRRRAAVLASGVPQKADFKVNRKYDGETSFYTATLKVNGDKWIVPVRGVKRVRAMEREDTLAGEVWLDDKGRVVGLSQEGVHLPVLPFPNKVREFKWRK